MKKWASILLLLVLTINFILNTCNASRNYYMVHGSQARCEFTDKITSTHDCDDARINTGYCVKKSGTSDNNVMVQREMNKPAGCYCSKSIESDSVKGGTVTLNSESDGESNDCVNEYCLCETRDPFYIVKEGATCGKRHRIVSKSECLKAAKTITDGCGSRSNIQKIVADESGNPNLPYGCYCKNNQIHFNLNTTNQQDCHGADQCVCKSARSVICKLKTENGTKDVEEGSEECLCCRDGKCSNDCSLSAIAIIIIILFYMFCCCCICGCIYVAVRALCCGQQQKNTPPAMVRHQTGQLVQGQSSPHIVQGQLMQPQIQKGQVQMVVPNQQMQPVAYNQQGSAMQPVAYNNNPVVYGNQQNPMQPVAFSPNQNNMMMQQQTSINSNAHLGMQQGVVVQAVPLNHNRQNI